MTMTDLDAESELMVHGVENDLTSNPSSSTRLFEKIQRNKFNGSMRCIALASAIAVIFLLNFVVAVIASVRGEYDLLLGAILWVSALTSMVVALVFVVNAEASSLTQHNTYGFARAEIVGAVIVCTFIAGVTLEGVMDSFELIFHELSGFSKETELECPEAMTEDSYLLRLSYYSLDVLIRLLFIILIGAFTRVSQHSKTQSSNDPIEDLFKWRSSNDNLLLHSFTLNLITGLGYDALQLVFVIHNRMESQTTSAEQTSEFPLTPSHSLGDEASIPNSQTPVNVTTLPQCEMWVQYLDKLSFPLSNFLVLPFLIWILRRSCLIVLQTVPPKFNANTLKKKLLLQVEGLTSVHEFHLWQLNANKIIVTLHVSCSREHSQAEYEKLREEITNFFHHEGIHSITVQPEFVDPKERKASLSCQFDCKEEWPGPSCYKLQCCLEEQQQLGSSHLNLLIEEKET